MPSKELDDFIAKHGKLYTMYDVAEYAKVNVVTIRNHIVKGALRSVKIGGIRRIREADLIEYLKGTEGEGKVK